MKQEQNKQIITIVKDGIPYRFTGIVNHGTHYSARMILDNGKASKTIHRIPCSEMEQATTEQNEQK